MAKEELVRLLKQGTSTWNTWRMQHPDNQRLDLVKCDLSGLDLTGVNLSDAALTFALLRQTKLSQANLARADLSYADLSQANLSGADLRQAVVMYANLNHADVSNANLSLTSLVETDFLGTKLYRTNLTQADLTGSVLCETVFLEANVSNADFTQSIMFQTILADMDLSKVGGLHSITHLGPSHVSLSTIIRSHGVLPTPFLRGIGTPEDFIESFSSFPPHLHEYVPCYIRYSHWDQTFAQQLHTDLQQLGVRCWLVPTYTGPQGERLKDALDEYIEASMTPNDTLVLIVSHHSIESAWLRATVSQALARVEQATPVVFVCQLSHVTLPKEWLEEHEGQSRCRIIDFTAWETKNIYDDKLLQLVTDIQESQ